MPWVLLLVITSDDGNVIRRVKHALNDYDEYVKNAYEFFNNYDELEALREALWKLVYRQDYTQQQVLTRQVCQQATRACKENNRYACILKELCVQVMN